MLLPANDAIADAVLAVFPPAKATP